MQKEQQQDILMSIQVPVSPQAYAYLELNANGKSPAEKLAAFTSWFIKRQANGGVMVEPADMDHIAAMNDGKRLETSRDIVRVIETAIKRQDGQYGYWVNVSRELNGPLEVQAEYNGCTVEQLLNGLGDEILQNGWAQEFTPALGKTLPLDEKGLLTARRVLGQFNFTGSDIAAALERLESLEKAGSKAA